MKKEYSNTGKCIRCGMEKPAVSFHTAPHIVPKYLDCQEIGTEISYFFQNKSEYRLLNQGSRIDYCLMNEDLLPYLTKSKILTDLMGTTNSPLFVEITLH